MLNLYAAVNKYKYILMIDSMTAEASWLEIVYSPHMLHTKGACFGYKKDLANKNIP